MTQVTPATLNLAVFTKFREGLASWHKQIADRLQPSVTRQLSFCHICIAFFIFLNSDFHAKIVLGNAGNLFQPGKSPGIDCRQWQFLRVDSSAVLL